MTQFDNRMKVDLSGFIFLSVFFHWHIAIECRDQLLQHYPNSMGIGDTQRKNTATKMGEVAQWNLINEKIYINIF